MEKAIILGVNKSKLRDVYVFKKEKKVIEPLIKIFKKLKLFNYYESYPFKEESGEYKAVNEFIDLVYHDKTQYYDADLIIGDKKIFLIIRTKEDRQQQITKIITKFADFKK